MGEGKGIPREPTTKTEKKAVGSALGRRGTSQRGMLGHSVVAQMGAVKGSK